MCVLHVLYHIPIIDLYFFKNWSETFFCVSCKVAFKLLTLKKRYMISNFEHGNSSSAGMPEMNRHRCFDSSVSGTDKNCI
jgi:hypothetical protein